MRERYQGGSLAGFIIIGVVLTLVLVGGLYGLSRYNAEQTKEVATDNKGASGEEPKKDKEAAPEPKSQPQPSVPAEPSSGDTKQEDKKNNQAASDDTAVSRQMPATGPADGMMTVLAVVALSYSTVHYARSRAYRSR